MGSGTAKTGVTAPTPILAAGTHVMQPARSTTNPIASTEMHLYDTLAGFFRSLAAEGYRSMLEPNDVVLGISDNLKKFGHGVGLPKMEKLQSIHNHLVKRRVSEALLFEYLTPENVVAALEAGSLDRLVKTILDMGGADFQATVRKGQKARDVGATKL